MTIYIEIFNHSSVSLMYITVEDIFKISDLWLT